MSPHLPSLQGKRILIIEQDDRLYCALKDTLVDAGCEVWEVPASFDEVSQIVPQSTLDAALVDTNWRGTPLSALVAQLHVRKVPVLCLGLGSPAAALGGGVSRRLPKPFTEQELLNSMQLLIA